MPSARERGERAGGPLACLAPSNQFPFLVTRSCFYASEPGTEKKRLKMNSEANGAEVLLIHTK